MKEQISAIFDQAMEIELPESQIAFVRKACSGNRELQQQVEQLLAAYHEDKLKLKDANWLNGAACKNFFNAVSDIETGIAKSDNWFEGELTERIGDCVGPFKLLEKIGSGGFGVVYRAKQSAPIRRQVAIKLIKPGMDTAEVLARFNLERQALAVMEHPNIAKIIDAGATQSGRPYFAMELVAGSPINQFCDDNKMSIRERLRLFRLVCEAVNHAHSQGLVHRDLKPGNVLVSGLPANATPKLIDFGVAKAIHREEFASDFNTRIEQAVGTPLYMSPEQAWNNKQSKVDHRADVYSLGVMLFELLTGSTPLSRDDLSNSSPRDVFELIHRYDSPTASRRISLDSSSLETVAANRGCKSNNLVRQIRGELDWVIAKAMDPDPNQRYLSVAELSEDLSRYLDGKSVQAGRPSRWYKLRKLVVQNGRALVIAASILTLCGISMAVLSNYRSIADQKSKDAEQASIHAKEADRNQREAKKLARTAQERFDATKSTLKTMLRLATDVGTTVNRQSLKAMVNGLLETAANSENDTAIFAEHLRDLGRACSTENQYEFSSPLLQKSFQIAERKHGKMHRFTLDTMYELAVSKLLEVYLQVGNNLKGEIRTPDVLKKYSDGLEINRQLVERERSLPPDLSQQERAWRNLAEYHREMGSKDEALEASEQAIHAAEYNPNMKFTNELMARMDLARTYLLFFGLEKSLASLDETRIAFEQKKHQLTDRERNYMLMLILNERTRVCRELGRQPEIVDDLKAVVELGRHCLPGGESHVTFPSYQGSLAQALAMAGREREAIDEMQKSLATYMTHRDKNWGQRTQTQVAATKLFKANTFRKIGETECAARVLADLVSDNQLMKVKPTVAGMRYAISVSLVEQSRYDDAIRFAQDTVTDLKNRYPSDQEIALQAQSFLADIYLRAERPEDALRTRLAAIAAADGVSQFDLVPIRQMLANDYLNSAELEIGISILEECRRFYQQDSDSVPNSKSPNRIWYVNRKLAQAYHDVDRTEEAISLLNETIQQQLKFFGQENITIIAVRMKLLKIYSDIEKFELTQQLITAIDTAFESLVSKAIQDDSKSWHVYNIRSSWLENRRTRAGIIGNGNAERTTKMLRKLEQDTLEHYSKLETSDIEDGDLKRDMLNRTCRILSKIYERLEAAEQKSAWDSKLQPNTPDLATLFAESEAKNNNLVESKK